jgi:hypothetical protein
VWTLPVGFASGVDTAVATRLLDSSTGQGALAGGNFCELDTDGTNLFVGITNHSIAKFDISSTPTFVETLDNGEIGNGVYDVELGQDGFLYAAINTGISQWLQSDGSYTGMHWSENTYAPGHLALTPLPPVAEPAGLGLLGIALLGLGYILSPVDLLPELLLCPIGLVDDLLVVAATLSRFLQLAPMPDRIKHCPRLRRRVKPPP